MSEINLYCDESNHLEKDGRHIMVLAAISCPKEHTPEINKRIKEIRARHELKTDFEIKWKKVSPAKIKFYLDVIDYFFDNPDIGFRGVVIDKKQLNHAAWNQSHDDFYYKMYFELLSKILDPSKKYNIYLDVKDTQGKKKIRKLRDVLCNNLYDFERSIVSKIQEVRSHEVQVLQIADLLAGALQFANRSDVLSPAKIELVNRIKSRSKYDLTKSTLLREAKLNIFHWVGQNG
ncbi:MAG: Phage P1-related protein in restrction modification operon RflA [Parcubacteria group bacterium GW2011_GWA1_50_14]|uniref:DUF3800 domain-containing protein n=1 Tax=Candidatus Liptonbacteria bacterium GWB1_49_6 TaxID=1798644 RepID=A0A1G2C5G0_9BACT|nr:MAG: Phage P1-related protein in restrction modification operon RflA [Parcubacteria group bacterium GW2011_GWA1_50_14]OGY96486.1 MAG: hypothetical protein A2122_02200 [Candidatus Liptonbacteria bacterium GWB1_49_6]